MRDPDVTEPTTTTIEEVRVIGRATTSCSVKITRKNADGDITSIESMNSMTTGPLEMTPAEAERLLYRITENCTRKCYVDLHVHEMLTAKELEAAVVRVKTMYRALGKDA